MTSQQLLDILNLIARIDEANNLQHAGCEIDPDLWSALYRSTQEIKPVVEKALEEVRAGRVRVPTRPMSKPAPIRKTKR